MNQHLPQYSLPVALEGVARRKWTSDDVLAMVRAGILGESDRIELLAGEIIAMPAKGARHEIVRNELVLHWSSIRPMDIKFAEESPLKLSANDEPEPDIILFPSPLRVSDVTGETVLLVVEIADSSLTYDLNVKGPLYAAFGVREYWVIDPVSVKTTVHRDPSANGYRSITELPADALLTPSLVPLLPVILSDLDIG